MYSGGRLIIWKVFEVIKAYSKVKYLKELKDKANDEKWYLMSDSSENESVVF